MSSLIDRLKVTAIKVAKGPEAPVFNKTEITHAPQHKAVAMPAPSAIRVAPPTVIKTAFVPNTSAREAELIRAASAVKAAEANAISEKRFNESMLADLKKEYADFVQKLMAEMEETGPLYFSVKEEPKKETLEQEEAVVEVPLAVESPVEQTKAEKPSRKRSRKSAET